MHTSGGEAQQDIIGNANFAGGEGAWTTAQGWRAGLGDSGSTGNLNLVPYIQLWNNNNNELEAFGQLTVVTNSWQMITWVYGGCGTTSCVSLYYNGQPQLLNSELTIDTLDSESIISTDSTWFGEIEYPGDLGDHYYFKGMITGLAIWQLPGGSPLTDDDVASLYSNGIYAVPTSVEPQYLTDFYPLNGVLDTDSVLDDLIGENTGANTGITFTEGPTVTQ
jgi:hypothetical protein